jgi:hypothetical protein
MKKQKEISTSIGIIIIALATVILFGGVFAYQYLAVKESQRVVKPDNQTTGFPMKIIETSDWQTYTNTKYGYEIKYPTGWITDVNLASYNNFGEGDVAFCPPELQDPSAVNGLTGVKPGCNVRKTNGGSINPEAPIVLFQYLVQSYLVKSSDCSSQTGNLRVDQTGKYCYKLVLADQKYSDVYNQMLSTFKFTTAVGSSGDWGKYTNDQLMGMVDENWKDKAMYFKGVEGNFIIIDQGTAPDPRGLVIYKLSDKKEVLSDRYSQPLDITATAVGYWSPTNQNVTVQNCPDSTKWLSEGLGAEIESHVSFDLTTLVKKDLGQTRCQVTQ